MSYPQSEASKISSETFDKGHIGIQIASQAEYCKDLQILLIDCSISFQLIILDSADKILTSRKSLNALCVFTLVGAVTNDCFNNNFPNVSNKNILLH